MNDWEEAELEGMLPEDAQRKSRPVDRITRPMLPNLPQPRRFSQPGQTESNTRPALEGIQGYINGDPMDDLLSVPESEDTDMETADLFEIGDDGSDDFSDLLDVDSSDIMGEAPAPPPQTKFRISTRGRRSIRREPPSAGLSGLRY